MKACIILQLIRGSIGLNKNGLANFSGNMKWPWRIHRALRLSVLSCLFGAAPSLPSLVFGNSLTFHVHLDAKSLAYTGDLTAPDYAEKSETASFDSTTQGGVVEARSTVEARNSFGTYPVTGVGMASMEVDMTGPDQWVFRGNATATGLDIFPPYAEGWANAWVDFTIAKGEFCYRSEGLLVAAPFGWTIFKQSHEANSPPFGTERYFDDGLVPPEVGILSPGTYRLSIAAFNFHDYDLPPGEAASFDLRLAPVPVSTPDSGGTAFLLLSAFGFMAIWSGFSSQQRGSAQNSALGAITRTLA